MAALAPFARTFREQQEWETQGDWVPANNRTETPFQTRTGRRLLYCYQPRSGKHAYLDCETDLILSEEESKNALGF